MVIGASLDIETTMDGHVYDFRLWSRALSATDVAAGRKVWKYPYDGDAFLA